MDLVFGGLYSEDALETGLTTDRADMLFASIPYKVMPSFHQPIFDAIKERDKNFYERLAKAGFMLDFGDDESGLFMKYVRRGSGYYIDVGASELIANGTIKLKSAPGLGVEYIEADAVVLNDGSRLRTYCGPSTAGVRAGCRRRCIFDRVVCWQQALLRAV